MLTVGYLLYCSVYHRTYERERWFEDSWVADLMLIVFWFLMDIFTFVAINAILEKGVTW